MIETVLADPWPPAEELGREVPEAVPQDDDCIVRFLGSKQLFPMFGPQFLTADTTHAGMLQLGVWRFRLDRTENIQVFSALRWSRDWSALRGLWGVTEGVWAKTRRGFRHRRPTALGAWDSTERIAPSFRYVTPWSACLCLVWFFLIDSDQTFGCGCQCNDNPFTCKQFSRVVGC